jgi:hypothetical protein
MLGTNNITMIGTNAFWGCSSLRGVILPQSLSNIEDGAFAYCANLANIIIPNSISDFSWYFSGPGWTNCPSRFYRLRSP